MEYRRLGLTGPTISRMVLGTMTFGEQNSEAESHAQLDLAVERGVNAIDTAEMYPTPPGPETQGRTEQFIGSWLKARGNRDKVVIMSKVTGRSNRAWIRPGSDTTRLDRPNIEHALENSLRRLGTDYIDVYQLHWPDRRTTIFGRVEYVHDPKDEPVPLEETLGVLQDFVRQGKIRHVGVSNETPWGLMKCLELSRTKDLPRVVSIQNPYSLLNRTFEAALAEVCHREEVGMLAYSPLGMGTLTGKYRAGAMPEGSRLARFPYFSRYTVPQGLQAASRYAEIAEKRGLYPEQLALAYILAKPFVTAPILGATSTEQLERNLSALDVALDEETLAEIESVHRAFPNPCP